jgi:NAD(P)-dependent dehydrogenase (short-subunit alcohol dehydrogenase family)
VCNFGRYYGDIMKNENCDSETRMDNKIVMITGANSGIGKETAKVLAERGATIIMISRNKERGEDALKELKEKTGSDKIELILADLTEPDKIHDAVDKFKEKYDHLDVLINNAGLTLNNREITSVGYEKTFATNHLGHFLLTQLLLDTLKQSKPSRIVNVASAVHTTANLKFSDINQKKHYRGYLAYANSKLANLLFTYELARRLEGTGVTVNALHPGFVKTNFGKRGRNWLLKALFGFTKLFAISVEKGAKTSIYLASSPEVEGVTGKYFAKCKPVKSSNASYKLEAQKRLWELSEHVFKQELITLTH